MSVIRLGSGVGVFLAPGFFVGSGDSSDSAFSLRFNLRCRLSSSFPVDFFVPDFALLFGAGDSSGSGVGLFRARALRSVPEIRPTRPGRFVLALGSPLRPPRSISWFQISLCALAQAIRPVPALELFLAAGVAVGFGLRSFFWLCASPALVSPSAPASPLGSEKRPRASPRAPYCARRASSFLRPVSCALTNVATNRAQREDRAREERERRITAERAQQRRRCDQLAGCRRLPQRHLEARSRSRRRIAFNFPPSSKSKQVKYIQVISTMMDASAR